MKAEQHQQIANLYSQQREAYAQYAPESFSWLFIEKPAFNRHVAPLLVPEAKILDAGCGTGRTINYLLESGADSHYITGIDLNFDMVKTTSAVAPEVSLVLSDLEQLPLSDNSQNLIICNHVLHYFDNDKYLGAMNEFRRVLKPGGILFMVIAHPVRATRGNLNQYFDRRWTMDQTPWGTQTPYYLRPISDLVNLGISSGLTLEVLDELEVDPLGQQHPAEYERYTNGPSRLALKFAKPASN